MQSSRWSLLNASIRTESLTCEKWNGGQLLYNHNVTTKRSFKCSSLSSLIIILHSPSNAVTKLWHHSLLVLRRTILETPWYGLYFCAMTTQYMSHYRKCAHRVLSARLNLWSVPDAGTLCFCCASCRSLSAENAIYLASTGRAGPYLFGSNAQLWQCRRGVSARIDSLQRFPLAVENWV